jgi:hypothetical protein
MDVIRYATRPSIATVETTYQVTDDELIWSSGPAQNRMRLADIQTVRLFTSPSVKYQFLGNAPFGGYDLFVVKAQDGRTLSVTSKHFQTVAVFEDRRANFVPFVDAVMARVVDINPAAVFLAGMPSGVWGLWIGILAVLTLGVMFGVLMLIYAIMGGGSLEGLILGLIFTVGTGFSLRSVLGVVTRGRQKSFDPRIGPPKG